MANLCLTALQNGIEREYVIGLIRKRKLVPEIPPIEVTEWPWQLKIYTLGEFKIIKNGKPIQFHGKTTKKPLLMLKILITTGSKGASEDQL